MSGRVIVIGSINVDLVVSGARLPRPGETVTGGRFEQHHGGKGGNQAVAAARLGARVLMIGAVGEDSFGSDARAALANEAVDVSGVVSVPGSATGIALILVDAAGENVISVASGANAAIEPDLVEARLTTLGNLRGAVVLVSNELPAGVVAAALRAAAASGARTIFNPAPADALDRAVLAGVDVLTPNRGELRLLSGADRADFDIVAAARHLAVREAVVVTLGADGALVVPRKGAARSVPAVQMDVVDTTGAGDTFNGALAAALASGQDLAAAVLRAVAAASLATTRAGAREGTPTIAELEAALRPD
ncbi:MAG: ribokinase [Candidatus Limnocylindrales bacterium]